MPRPLFLQGAREQRAHSRGTPEPTPSAKGSTSGAFIASATLMGSWVAVNTAIACSALGEWAWAGASVVSAVVALGAFGIFARLDGRKQREAEASQIVREAEARRSILKATLAEMNIHDPRRGSVERELKAQTFVVLNGGRL